MPARYNIAPTQDVPAVTESRDGHRKLRMLRWGLVPHWARDLSIGNTMINAKSETLEEKPAFKTAFARRRCLIPSDGFYEWKEIVPEELPVQESLFGGAPTPAKGKKPKSYKQPYHITPRDRDLFAFAGLWERWSDADGRIVDTCTVVTTEPNELIRPLHDRMPAIIAPEDFAIWLEPNHFEPDTLRSLLAPFPPERMRMTPVSTWVNNANNEGPECIEQMA